MKKLLFKSERFFKKNGSTILTCVGAGGVVATTVLAVKATPKALAILEEAKEEKGEELTTLEKINVAGPAYIPAALMGVSTIACIFGANALNKRQQAALTSAYALLDNSYKEFKKKVDEVYGEGASNTVKNEIAKDQYDEEANKLGYEDTELFYDAYSERYFESTMENVVRAEYNINKKISLWGGADLNDFYDFLDIPSVEYGNYVGWSEGWLMEASWVSWLDFQHEKVELEDGMECTIITMTNEPVYDYEYY